jgi:MFS family permease
VAAISAGVDRASREGWSDMATIGLLAAGVALIGLFPVRERHTSNPLIDLALFRNLPFDLVTFLGSVSNVCYAVTIFVVSLYLQNARGLSPVMAGVVFLGLASLVALAGPIGARLQPHFRPTAVMAGAGGIAGLGLLLLASVTSWWAYVPVFAICGFGLGLGWTFSNIATQEVVDPDRAGEASGVVLTFLVTCGGIGLAGAASIIAAFLHAGHSAASAYDETLRIFALVSLGAAVMVMVIRHLLVRRGIMKPLSMAAERVPPPAAVAAGTGDGAGHMGRNGDPG